jgi:hypothetical protein
LNRFIIERVEIDDDHSRLHFSRGDCRFELTVGKSVRQDDQWVAVPVALFLNAEQPKIRIQIQQRHCTRPIEIVPQLWCSLGRLDRFLAAAAGSRHVAFPWENCDLTQGLGGAIGKSGLELAHGGPR